MQCCARYKNLHNATPVTNDEQSIEKKSCYVHEHDKLFTIIGNKSKYICRVLYETSLSMKGRKCYRETSICTYSNFRVTIVMTILLDKCAESRIYVVTKVIVSFNFLLSDFISINVTFQNSVNAFSSIYLYY